MVEGQGIFQREGEVVCVGVCMCVCVCVCVCVCFPRDDDAEFPS